jgi:hypothetical protein
VEAVGTDGNVSPMSEVVWAATLALPTLPAKLVAIPVSTAEIGFEMSDAFAPVSSRLLR